MDSLRNKLNSARVTPGPMVWEKIDNNLSIEHINAKNRQTRRWIGIAAGLFVLFASWTIAEIVDKNSYKLESLDIDQTITAVNAYYPENLNKNIDKYEMRTPGKLLPNYRLLSEKALVVSSSVK